MLLGIVGPMQSGKQENRVRIAGQGFHFLDVNPRLERARCANPNLTQLYNTLGLDGCLDERGRRTTAYYQRVMDDPELHQLVQARECDVAKALLSDELAGIAAKHIAISWGYLHTLARALPFDHFLLLGARKTVWFERLRRRAVEQGGSSEQLTDDVLRHLIQSTEMEPKIIQSALRASGVPLIYIDTSDAVWGGDNVALALEMLLGPSNSPPGRRLRPTSPA